MKNEKLTKREKKICKDIIEGLSYEEIAEKEFIELSTVKTHAISIFKKLKVKGAANPRITIIVRYYKRKLKKKAKIINDLRRKYE